MAGVNKAILIGHVGKDPEIRKASNGNQNATFSLATSKSWRDKTSGERREKTQWHQIAVWNEGLVGVVGKYVKKGSKLYIEGEIETSKYTDRGGVERYATWIVLSGFAAQLVLLDKSEGGSRPPPPDEPDAPRPGADGKRDDMDDEIPF